MNPLFPGAEQEEEAAEQPDGHEDQPEGDARGDPDDAGPGRTKLAVLDAAQREACTELRGVCEYTGDGEARRAGTNDEVFVSWHRYFLRVCAVFVL